MALNWFQFSSPATFYPLAGRLIPLFGWAAALLAAIGLWLGFGVAPTDHQQGEVYRVIFIHVPSAWMSMFLYVVMAFWGALLLGFNTRLVRHDGAGHRADRRADDLHRVVDGRAVGPADVGHLLGVGRADDLRAHPAVPLLRHHRAAPGDHGRRAGRTARARCCRWSGVVNIPIIYYSVKWWNTLHQGASVKLTGSSMETTMLAGMLVMSFAFWFYAIAVVLARVRTIMLERERGAAWVAAQPEMKHG